MLNLPGNQNACQGTSVQVSIDVNQPASPPNVPIAAASFTVTKWATPWSVYAGSSTPITYTLTATNTGTAPGTVTVGDAAPAGTTLVSGSNSCPSVTAPTTSATSVTGSTVHWTITDVPAGGSVAVSFEVTADSGDSTGTIANTGTWSGPGCAAAVTCPTNTTTTNVTARLPS